MANCRPKCVPVYEMVECKPKPVVTPIYSVISTDALIIADQSRGSTVQLSGSTRLARAVEKIEKIDTDKILDSVRDAIIKYNALQEDVDLLKKAVFKNGNATDFAEKEELEAKADKSELEALREEVEALKSNDDEADQNHAEAIEELKAEQEAQNDLLNDHETRIEQLEAESAEQAEKIAELEATKADKAEVAEALAEKADKAETEAALETKADKAEVEAKFAEMVEAVSDKANQDEVDTLKETVEKLLERVAELEEKAHKRQELKHEIIHAEKNETNTRVFTLPAEMATLPVEEAKKAISVFVNGVRQKFDSNEENHYTIDIAGNEATIVIDTDGFNPNEDCVYAVVAYLVEEA